jgi:hypothetical protein
MDATEYDLHLSPIYRDTAGRESLVSRDTPSQNGYSAIMGFFDFIRKKAKAKAEPAATAAPPSRAEFARLFMDALQAAGLEGLAYNNADFSIDVAMANSRFFLDNAYAEFVAAPDDEAKKRVIARFTGAYERGLPVTPEAGRRSATRSSPSFATVRF